MPIDPLPADFPITLYRGDTRVWSLLIEEIDDLGVATPKNLTGYTFDAEIRVAMDTTVVMSEIDVIADNDPTSGLLTLTLTATEAAKLVPGTAYWDLELTRTSDDFVRTYLAGKITIRGDVSRTP